MEWMQPTQAIAESRPDAEMSPLAVCIRLVSSQPVGNKERQSGKSSNTDDHCDDVLQRDHEFGWLLVGIRHGADIWRDALDRFSMEISRLEGV